MVNSLPVSRPISIWHTPSSADNAWILAFDTASRQASYALLCGGTVRAECTAEPNAPQAEAFFPTIQALFTEAGCTLADLTALVAVNGPGSFTGLRVGIAAGLGLAQSLAIPALGVTALEAVALAAGQVGFVVSLLDAGRGELYFSLRELRTDGQLHIVLPDQVVTPDQLADLLAPFPSLTLAGDWAETNAARLRELASGRAWEIAKLADAVSATLAGVLGKRAHVLLQQGEPLPQLAAVYVRPPDVYRTAAQSHNQPKVDTP